MDVNHSTSQRWQPDQVGEQAKAWRTSILSDLEVLHATYVTHTFPRHVHEEFCIGVVLRGAEKIDYRGTTHLAPAGSLVILQPGEVHSNCAADAGGWSYKVFYPPGALMQSLQAEWGGGRAALPFFPQAVVQDRVLFPMILRLHWLVEQPQSSLLLETESHLLLTLRQLMVCHAQQLPAPVRQARSAGVIQQVKDYLHAYYADNPSLQHLAVVAGLSPYHLTRLFKATVGLPPHAYLNQIRITQAKILLAQNATIAQVAADIGFTDQSHFSKTFKSLVGVTPGQYRRYTFGCNGV